MKFKLTKVQGRSYSYMSGADITTRMGAAPEDHRVSCPASKQFISCLMALKKNKFLFFYCQKSFKPRKF